MTAELILSIISLVLTTAVGVLTLFVNIKVSKISHLKDLHEYQKDISYFELINRDEKWLYDLIQNDEFGKYSKEAQQKIIAWYLEYQKTHPSVLLKTDMDVEAIERLRRSRDVRLQMMLRSPGPQMSKETMDLILNKMKNGEEINPEDLDDGSTDW